MKSSLPSGTVTFLFTDIEGSTSLWQEMPEAMARAHMRHNTILREAIESNNGHIIQIVGDSFKVAFHNALDALLAVIAAQHGLQAESWGETGPLRVRMGLNTGAAELARDGSSTYFEGYATIASAQRIMSVAHGGQVLLSRTTHDLLLDELPENVSLRDMGEHRLKGLRSPLHLHQLVMPGLPQEFPAIESLDLFPNNLPLQLTAFIGREKEMDDIKGLLNSARLVTLTGPGGTGKTRLSLEVGDQELRSFSHGVWLIELASLTDPSQIIPAMAQVFGLRGVPSTPLGSLVIDYLREKTTLLILDNCEHLIDACAHLAHDLLRQCPELKIIASSREAMGIAGEVIYSVPPLAAEEAIQLFLERARAANPRFNLTTSNESAVARICSRLDGIPLAIELAAARISLLSPKQIAERLDDRFRLLVSKSRTVLPRQQTLRALIDWSYDLLSEEERTLLRQLSVFSGGWTLEAAEAICPDLDILILLTELVNKSLVTTMEEIDATRYHLLETIRHYAREKLAEAGEYERAHSSHAEYYLQLAKNAEPKLVTSDSLRWLKLLEAEHDNLRATFKWFVEQHVESALKLVIALTLYWSLRGNQAEGRAWGEAAIARAEALSSVEGTVAHKRKNLIAYTLGSLVILAVVQGDNAYVESVSEKCAALARELGDQTLLAQTLSYTCSGRLVTGDVDGVEEMMREGMIAARESGDAFTLGMALGVSAELLMFLGRDHEKMEAYLEEGITLLEESGNLWGLTILLLEVGMMARYRRRYDESRSRFATLEPLLRKIGDKHRLNLIRSEYAHMDRYEGNIEKAELMYRETIVEWQRLGHRAAIAHQLESFAFIAIGREHLERAARLLGAAESLRERISIDMSPSEREEYDVEVAKLRAGTDYVQFKSEWNEGRTMTMDQAISYALESGDKLPKTP